VSSVRGVATAAAAVVAVMAGPPMVIYALAVLSTIAATLYRPAHSALLPSLCRTGFELTSANVVRGLLDSAATLIGPLLAAVLLQFAGVGVVFAFAAAASFGSAALLVRLRHDAPPRPPAPRRSNLLSEAVDGVKAVTHNRDLTLILGLAGAQALTRGALTVLSVVLAIELLLLRLREGRLPRQIWAPVWSPDVPALRVAGCARRASTPNDNPCTAKTSHRCGESLPPAGPRPLRRVPLRGAPRSAGTVSTAPVAGRSD
jgi:hypothetical protein